MSGFAAILALPWAAIWSVLKAVGELGLVIFAGTQVLLQRRDRSERERIAFGVAYVEYWRLKMKSLDWSGADMVNMATAGKLYYSDIATPDWGVVITNLSTLGIGSAALGSFGSGLVNQVVDTARLLAESKGIGVGAMTGRQLESHCRTTLQEVVLAFEDALAEAPRQAQALRLKNASPKSDVGKRMLAAYLERQALPSPGTRAGRFLSSIVRILEP